MSDLDFGSVLFLCVANSARSQMAEGLARALLGDRVEVRSAGSSPTRVNPYAIRAMDEVGIDIREQRSTSVTEVDAAAVDLVVTLCAEEVCPTALGQSRRLHWPLRDPDRAGETMTDEARLGHFRITRDAIRERIVTLMSGAKP